MPSPTRSEASALVLGEESADNDDAPDRSLGELVAVVGIVALGVGASGFLWGVGRAAGSVVGSVVGVAGTVVETVVGVLTEA